MPHTRPTKDRVKEALFNQLEPLSAFESVCDLFAGIGSLAFEAASRGAQHVFAVENDKKTFSQLAKNNEALGLNIQLYCHDALDFLSSRNHPFDLIFCDPPYDSQLIDHAMSLIHSHRLLTPKGLVVCLHDTPFDHSNFELIKQKKYGLTYVSLWRELP